MILARVRATFILCNSSKFVETFKRLYVRGNINNSSIFKNYTTRCLASRLQTDYISWLLAKSTLSILLLCPMLSRMLRAYSVLRQQSNKLIIKRLGVAALLLYIFQHWCRPKNYWFTQFVHFSNILRLWAHNCSYTLIISRWYNYLTKRD